MGALLEARAIHPGRSAFDHLWYLAQSNDIAQSRVYEVLEFVGLSEVAHKRAGKFSLGMGQRLGIAGALLGDPGVLLFDEPINGLDPEGILWVRNLLRGLASEGRTVLVSSHLMSEMALTADQLLIIGRGRSIFAGSATEFTAKRSGQFVRVSSPRPGELSALLTSRGAHVTEMVDGSLEVSGLSAESIGESASLAGINLRELSEQRASLEDAFMELTRDNVEFRGVTGHGSRLTRSPSVSNFTSKER